MTYTIAKSGNFFIVRKDAPTGGTVPAFAGFRFATEKAARDAILTAMATVGADSK